MRLTPEHEQEIRDSTKDGYCSAWYATELLSEIDAQRVEIDALRAEIKQALKNYQDQHHDFAVMCGHYTEALKERDQFKAENEKMKNSLDDECRHSLSRIKENQKLRERIAKLREALCEIGTESGAYANTILAARRALAQDDSPCRNAC